MNQTDSIWTDAARFMLDQLLEDSRLYKTGSNYKALLDFIVRLRNFVSFNAFLQIQKPGLHRAASARDWRKTFGRSIKDAARPLLILWPFEPVALVYDLMDTEGDPMPTGISAFAATGTIDPFALEHLVRLLNRKSIAWNKVDASDQTLPGATETPDAHSMGAHLQTMVNALFAECARHLREVWLFGHGGSTGRLGPTMAS